MHTDALKSSKFVIEINTHTVTTIGRAGICWHGDQLRNCHEVGAEPRAALAVSLCSQPLTAST